LPTLTPASATNISMISLSFLTWAICVLPIEGAGHHWKRQEGYLSQLFQTSSPETSAPSSSSSTSTASVNTITSPSPTSTIIISFSSSNTSTVPYSFSVPSVQIIEPTLTSQGMIVSSIIPLYEVCNMPGFNTTSCSTVFETITTDYCSTVLTYAFTQTTITDCAQSITFSTDSSFSLATTTPLTTTAAVIRNAERQVMPPISSPAPITYVQSIVSYYIAPWQSLAARTPSNITLRVCSYDYTGGETCNDIQEIWVVHTEYTPVTISSILSISTILSSVCITLPILHSSDEANPCRPSFFSLAQVKVSLLLQVHLTYLLRLNTLQ
jgi:hypothetical protein